MHAASDYLFSALRNYRMVCKCSRLKHRPMQPNVRLWHAKNASPSTTILVFSLSSCLFLCATLVEMYMQETQKKIKEKNANSDKMQ
ncbi:hypothetical protein BU24DRAFT_217525 [Aaosphaeria arxii CBS 175.79]|uniref:Uncharacterized protein n=1 Tax=Aaosphaeria arxii CBS 175.79 TaxID=1450172 RepID=A0A6A5XNX2_9PLEO|nr:uncharacterized protein BU24DRAFT_217525 [Aaosphaeria arxii CBS 175.79]KAF2014606.1 hypothetical protein BU24DRAFT_217525 [Aaosphaeria arxii CBS 175.79]